MSGSMSMFDGADLAPPMDWTAGILPGTTAQVDPNAAGVAGSAGVSIGTGTGQHGVVPVNTEGGMGGAIESVWNWINTPFTTPLDPWETALIVGIVMVAIVFWSLILYHVKVAAETI